MLTFSYQQPVKISEDGPEKLFVIGDGLSTDELPTEGIANGSQITLMDSSKIKKFDEENQQWREFSV